MDASAASRKRHAPTGGGNAAALAAQEAAAAAGAGAGTQFGPAGATQAQMEAAVAAKPADALAAVQKAMANINLEPSQNPDATVLSYING